MPQSYGFRTALRLFHSVIFTALRASTRVANMLLRKAKIADYSVVK
jgi:hypothetical protein